MREIKAGDKVRILLSNNDLKRECNYLGNAQKNEIRTVLRVGIGAIQLTEDNYMNGYIKFEHAKFLPYGKIEIMSDKKEVAGVDFVYGIELIMASFPGLCHNCCFWDVRKLACLRGTADNECGKTSVYTTVEIPRKKPHVVGLGKIGAWLEENGYWYDSINHIFLSKTGCLSDDSIKKLFGRAGQTIDHGNDLPKELIEYK